MLINDDSETVSDSDSEVQSKAQSLRTWVSVNLVKKSTAQHC